MSGFLQLMYARKMYIRYRLFKSLQSLQACKSLFKNYILRLLLIMGTLEIYIYMSVAHASQTGYVWRTCTNPATVKDQLSCLSLHIDVDKNNSSVLQRVMVPGDDTVAELQPEQHPPGLVTGRRGYAICMHFPFDVINLQLI